jgi:hypothetical protein
LAAHDRRQWISHLFYMMNLSGKRYISCQMGNANSTARLRRMAV